MGIKNNRIESTLYRLYTTIIVKVYEYNGCIYDLTADLFNLLKTSFVTKG